MSTEIIRLQSVVKQFTRGDSTLRAVDGVSLTITQGQFAAVMGKSGSGKSTLLHLMSGLLQPTAGSVQLLGQELSHMKDDQLTELRRDRIGFIFQFFNLLPTLSALENAALPLMLARVRPAVAEAKAKRLLELVGLGPRANHRPDELSGGQMQRVAIARALITEPPILFADEPTGNLDSVSGEEVLLLLKEMQAERGQTVVMVTHDPKAAAYGDRLITMRDGQVQADQWTGGGTQ